MKDSAAAGVTPLQSLGVALDDSPAAFGHLRDSAPVAGDVDLLRHRLEEDGYLWIRGLLDPTAVLDARRQVIEWLVAERLLKADRPIMDAVAAPQAASGFTPEARRFPAVRQLLHTGRLIDVFTRLLGGEVRALDYIWMRLMSPGQATGPHCDIVYMSRGTARLYTAWVPLGDVPRRCGPLMLLEGSHRSDRIRSGYARMDIDKDRNWTKIRFRHGKLFRGGDYSRNPRAVQREFGSRWLTADFAGGDVVIMSVFLMHGSLDNRSDRIRVSADARYQLASDPVDERWIGERPIAHARR